MPNQLQEYGLTLVKSPAFWDSILVNAAHATERAAPDYTWGHKIAAAMDHLLTGSTIHTPDAAHAESVVNALADAFKAVVSDAVKVAPPPLKAPGLP